MKTLNMIFADRRLASTSAAERVKDECDPASPSDQWLARLNYLRSICFVPGADPFGVNPSLLRIWQAD